jgi:hypothetical protein
MVLGRISTGGTGKTPIGPFNASDLELALVKTLKCKISSNTGLLPLKFGENEANHGRAGRQRPYTDSHTRSVEYSSHTIQIP